MIDLSNTMESPAENNQPIYPNIPASEDTVDTDTIAGKLKHICPPLFNSLSSWELNYLDSTTSRLPFSPSPNSDHHLPTHYNITPLHHSTCRTDVHLSSTLLPPQPANFTNHPPTLPPRDILAPPTSPHMNPTTITLITPALYNSSSSLETHPIPIPHSPPNIATFPPTLANTRASTSRITTLDTPHITSLESEHQDFAHTIQDSLQFIPGTNQSQPRENTITDLLDSLLPSYKVVLSPIPLPAYLGKPIHKTPTAKGTSDHSTTTELTQEQEHTWSRGYSYFHSHIKTISAQRKEGHNTSSNIDSPSQSTDIGVLIGIKSLTCAK